MPAPPPTNHHPASDAKERRAHGGETLTFLLFPLIVASGVLAIYWSVAIGHVVATRLKLPTARSALRFPEASDADVARAPSVCVIVPAHNEEAIISTVTRSLAAQDYPYWRVVFALDRCTDCTRARIEEAIGGDTRFEIIEISYCPPDWAGKVNAMCRALEGAASVAGADILLFTDADTQLDPACLRATVALMQNRALDMLSLLSTLTTRAWFEAVVQPAAALELIRQYPVLRANRAHERRAFLNGQFIMAYRAAYDRIGGHESVKDALFEDVALARSAERGGLRVGVFLADGMLTCRMYPTYQSFQRGWNRIFGDAANRKPGRLRTSAWRLRALAVFLPLAALLSVVLGAANDANRLSQTAIITGAAGLAAFTGALSLVYRIGRTPLWALPAYPVGAWMTSNLLSRAARGLEAGERVVWGGREYERPSR
ncbi:MAG: glycosyltransferase [Phycisphaerales bacterium]|nr:glycosyltransferase [Phycisphaerales bacterium]